MVKYFLHFDNLVQNETDLIRELKVLVDLSLSHLASNRFNTLEQSEYVVQGLALLSFLKRLHPDYKRPQVDEMIQQLDQTYSTRWIYAIPDLQEWISYNWDDTGDALFSSYHDLEKSILTLNQTKTDQTESYPLYSASYLVEHFQFGISFRLHHLLEIMLALESAIGYATKEIPQEHQTNKNNCNK